jgi:translation elongation factor P/translation initiation factor 5A
MAQVINQQASNINLKTTPTSRTENSSNLKLGNYVIFKNQAYKVTHIYSTQTNLIQITGTNSISGDKIIEWFEGTDGLELPKINFKEYSLEKIEGDKFVLKDENGATNNDIELPKGEGSEEIKKHLETNQSNIKVKTVNILGQELFDSLVIN